MRFLLTRRRTLAMEQGAEAGFEHDIGHLLLLLCDEFIVCRLSLAMLTHIHIHTYVHDTLMALALALWLPFPLPLPILLHSLLSRLRWDSDSGSDVRVPARLRAQARRLPWG